MMVAAFAGARPQGAPEWAPGKRIARWASHTKPWWSAAARRSQRRTRRRMDLGEDDGGRRSFPRSSRGLALVEPRFAPQGLHAVLLLLGPAA